MPRRLVAVYGASAEALELLPSLDRHPAVELAAVYDPDAALHRRRLPLLDLDTADPLARLLTDDPAVFEDEPALDAVIDAGIAPPFRTRFGQLVARGVEVLSPAGARRLWGLEGPEDDPRGELLRALQEIADALSLASEPGAVYERLLEIALTVTGAEGGSLMLLDRDEGALGIRAALGVEPALWPQIRLRAGEGIAGRALAEGRPLRLRGRADPGAFRIVRARFDVAAALCVPLLHRDQPQGVLNLHHPTRSDLFANEDLAFATRLGALDGRIVARARELEQLRGRVARLEVSAAVQQRLAHGAPTPDRLAEFCREVAEQTGGGVATLWRDQPAGAGLRLAASSLEGGALAGALRLAAGRGVDGRAVSEGCPQLLRAEDGSLAYAALPLRDGDASWGLLSIQLGGDGAPATEPLLRTLAEAAGAALVRAERERERAARTARLEAVQESGLALLATGATPSFADTLARRAALVTEAQHAVVRLLDPEQQRFPIRAHAGPADPLRDELFALDRRAAALAARRRRTVTRAELDGGDDTERTLLAVPLLVGGRPRGTVGVYDRNPAEAPGEDFDTLDRDTLERLAAFASAALARQPPDPRPPRPAPDPSTAPAAEAPEDETTRWPASPAEAGEVAGSSDARTGGDTPGETQASGVERALREAIDRLPAGGALTVASCRIENGAALRASSPAEAEQAAQRTEEALRGHVRPGDEVWRTGADGFALLLPDPGPAPTDRLAHLARAVADQVTRAASGSAPRAVLAFGYALHPADGDAPEALLERAAAPRIRML